jgi:uncharacterized protein (TIGR00369 family)
VSAFVDSETGRAVNRVTQVSLHEVDEPGRGPTDPHVRGEVLELEHLRGPAGNVRAGALLTIADTVGGMCAGLAALPGWVVSTNLMLRTEPHEHRGPLALDARILRAGRNAVVTQVTIVDTGDAERVIADGVLTSAVLVPEGGPPDFERPMVLEAPPAPDPVLPLLEFFAVRPVDPTSVALEINDRVRNPWGILHGGAIAVLVDAAATHTIGAGATTADVVLHFLRPGRVGPAIARAAILGDRRDGHLLRVEVVDTGGRPGHGRRRGDRAHPEAGTVPM